jgi:hypothetical protein
MSAPIRYSSIMAVYPNSRGFAFVLFEGALAPLDWGLVEIRGQDKNRECLRRIGVLFGSYEPAALILQEMAGDRAYRAQRIRSLNEAIATLAETQGISVFTYSRARVRECFEHLGAPTKQYIAEVIAKHIPAFERYLPPPRKRWRSEDFRMGLFDAAALGLTFFQASERVKDRAVLA